MRVFHRTLLEAAGADIPSAASEKYATDNMDLARALLAGNPAATFHDVVHALRPDLVIDVRFGRDDLRIRVRRHETAWVELGRFDRTGKLGDELTITVRTPETPAETETKPSGGFDPVAAAREVCETLPPPSEAVAAKYPGPVVEEG